MGSNRAHFKGEDALKVALDEISENGSSYYRARIYDLKTRQVEVYKLAKSSSPKEVRDWLDGLIQSNRNYLNAVEKQLGFININRVQILSGKSSAFRFSANKDSGLFLVESKGTEHDLATVHAFQSLYDRIFANLKFYREQLHTGHERKVEFSGVKFYIKYSPTTPNQAASCYRVLQLANGQRKEFRYYDTDEKSLEDTLKGCANKL